ncbi:MAG: hypothetical protein RR505_01845 [Raoultibacter sp.]
MAVRSQTKDKLAFALFTLMKGTPYSQISVSVLCAEAHVERSTYYRNILSKEELVTHRIALIMDEYLTSFVASKQYTFEDYMLALFKTFKANKAVFEALLKNNLGDLLLDSLQHSFDSASGMSEAPLEERYHLCFHVGGIYNYIRLWMCRDTEDTPAQLAHYVKSLFPEDFTPIRLRLMATALHDRANP